MTNYNKKLEKIVFELLPARADLDFQWTASFKNVKDCLNSIFYSYLETSGSQSSNLYLNAVHFFQRQC